MKKRLLSLLLALTLACSLLVFPANAAEVVDSGTCGENVTWVFTDDGVLTISGTGAMEDYVGRQSPWYGSGIQSAVIDSGVTSIGSGAFSGCSSLTSVTIPDSVISIGSSAFIGCSSLPSVTIPDGVISIEVEEFFGCSSLTEVVIPDSVTSIGNYAFYNCSGLTSVTIPDSVTSIGESAFYNCSSLTSVTIPDSITSIRDSVFYNCSSLTSVTIPDSITSIGDSVFYNCSSLTSVTIPDSVTSIGKSAFYNCNSLTSVLIPNSVTSIGGGAFSCCSSMTEVKIPDSVTSISNSFFSGCSSLTSVTIPDSVTSIGSWAFNNCSNLINVMIPDSVTSIKYSAFAGCSSLIIIEFPDSVSWIESYAFQDCTSLDSLSLHFTDEKGGIGESAFQGCEALKSVEIITAQNAYTSIGSNAFRDCVNLETFSIQSDETKVDISSNAFQNCTSLENVSLAVRSASISSNVFQGSTSLQRIQFPNRVSLSSNAFDGCTGLTSITIPNIDTIPERAFQNCTGLESLTIESGVKTIDNYAFLGCSALKTVTLPESLTNVNTGAFRNCNSIANVYYGGNSTQWSSIQIKSYNEPLTGASIHYSGSAPAKIESDPSDVLTTAGKPATFSVVASGDIASWQWQVKTTSGSWKNSTAPGCTTDTMRTTATAARNGYQYRCIVSDADGNTVISEPATLTVAAPAAITGSPMDCVGKAGQIASFAVSAEGEGLTYQWQFSDDGGETWKNSSVKSAIYSTKMTAGRNGRMVRCVVTDQFGNSAVSDAALMRLKNPLVITKLPENYLGKVNSTASFTVTAQGSGLSYQWQYSDNGTKWSNSSVKSAVYSTKLTDARDGRMVRCIVTDQFGNSVTSAPASMKIG